MVAQTSELEASGEASGVVPSEPPFVPPLGQLPRGWAVEDGASVAEGAVVVALGAGEADGSAADTAATPPRARSPTASVPTMMLRRNPPIPVGAGAGPHDAGGDSADWAGSSFQFIVNTPSTVG
jgi:hypothetical protein